MPSTISCCCSDDCTPNARHVASERRADKALASYFAHRNAGRVTKGDATVAAVLATLKPHHRAALSMQHAPRAWPPALTRVCGNETSLVVRLYCCEHPTVGRTADIESAAAHTLAASISAGTTTVLDRLHGRAMDHTFRAEAAFRKALEAHRSASG
jgi:hypothetical protein